MAIGTPVSLGIGFLSSATTTVVLTIGATGAAVGDRVIVVCGDDGGANIPSGVVDSKGNSYAADDAGLRLADNYTARIFSATLATALTSGDTITATVNGGGGAWDKFIAATKVSGLDSGVIDKSASATGTGTAWDSGLTAATTQADELVFGLQVHGGAGASATPGAGLTELHDVDTGAFVDYQTVYKIVSATGQYKANGTIASSDNWGAIVVTYKATGAGVVAVGRDLAAPWTIRARAGRDSALPWVIRTTAGRDLATLWTLRTRAGRDVDVPWTIRAVAGRDLAALWTLRAAIGGDVVVPWLVRAAAGRDLTLPWTVRVLAARDVELRWSIGQALVTVGRDLIVPWTVRALAGAELAAPWTIRCAAGRDNSLPWTVRGRAGAELEAPWTTRNAAGRDVSLAWLLRHAAGAELAAPWTIQLAAGRELLLAWRVGAELVVLRPIAPPGSRHPTLHGSTHARAGESPRPQISR